MNEILSAVSLVLLFAAALCFLAIALCALVAIGHLLLGRFK